MMIRKMQLDDLPQVAAIEQSKGRGLARLLYGFGIRHIGERSARQLFGIRLSRKRLILSLL